jgi:multiple sugar transport system permease protein
VAAHCDHLARHEGVLSVVLTPFTGQYGTEWHLSMAAAATTLVPTLLVFIFTRGYFVQRIALTGFGGR